MKIKTISTARFILFVVGFVLTCALIAFLMPEFFPNSVTCYVVIVALLAYTAVALPLVVSFELNNGLLVGGIVYYRGASLFGIASVVLAILAISAQKVSKLLIVLEAIALFGFAVYVLLSYAASNHTESIKAEEEDKTAVLSVLKSDALRLKQMADSLDGAYEIKQIIGKISDGVRYLSPSNNPEAVVLEMQIIETINSIDLSQVTAAQLKELEMIYRQRKSLY